MSVRCLTTSPVVILTTFHKSQYIYVYIVTWEHSCTGDPKIPVMRSLHISTEVAPLTGISAEDQVEHTLDHTQSSPWHVIYLQLHQDPKESGRTNSVEAIVIDMPTKPRLERHADKAFYIASHVLCDPLPITFKQVKTWFLSSFWEKHTLLIKNTMLTFLRNLLCDICVCCFAQGVRWSYLQCPGGSGNDEYAYSIPRPHATSVP